MPSGGPPMIEINDRLHLLGLQNLDSKILPKLKEIIDQEKLDQTYSMEHILDTVYLWR